MCTARCMRLCSHRIVCRSLPAAFAAHVGQPAWSQEFDSVEGMQYNAHVAAMAGRNPRLNICSHPMTVHGAGVRCVRHRCVAAAPLPLPLPFPQLFAPTVLRHGDMLCAASGQGPGPPALQGQGEAARQWAGLPSQGGAWLEVEAVPVLSRMYATAAATDFARRQLQVFRGKHMRPVARIAGGSLLPYTHEVACAWQACSGAGLLWQCCLHVTPACLPTAI